MTRLRILHVLDNLGNGGLQNGLSNLIDRLDPERFEHVLCAIRPVEDKHVHPFSPDRARTMCIGDRKLSRVQIPALLRVIKQMRPHIVHSRNWAAIEAVPAARLAGRCGIIHSEHGIDQDTAQAEPRRRSCLRRLAFELADRVLSVSRIIRDLHSRRTLYPAEKIQVINNGVDNKRFRPDPVVRMRVRRELGIGDNDFCLGSVGNLVPVKDQLTIMRALVEFSNTTPGWRLLLAGDGPELRSLTEFATTRPECRGRILFLGRSKRIPELLNAMDIYVLSSITEGINNSLLEAMATGLPVVASRTGGNPEVVLEGETGLLFPVGDPDTLAAHLSTLYADDGLRQRFSTAACARVAQDFSMVSMVHQYEQLYLSVAPVAGVAEV